MEDKINDGGDAFENVTVRDEFALKIMPDIFKDVVADDEQAAYDAAAEECYRIADAMLKARTTPTP